MRNPWLREMIMLAHRYDTMSEQLITDNMCTNTCPCLEYGTEFDGIDLTTKEFYNLVKEETMNKYGRTNLQASLTGLEEMVWTRDLNKGFKSFEDCHKHWEDKAKTNRSINLNEVFAIHPSSFKNESAFYHHDYNSTEGKK